MLLHSQLHVISKWSDGAEWKGRRYTSIQLVRTCLVLNWYQEKKSSPIKKTHASFMEVRTNGLIQDFLTINRQIAWGTWNPAIFAQQGDEDPREAIGRIVCANCHLANKPVDIEVPQADWVKRKCHFGVLSTICLCKWGSSISVGSLRPTFVPARWVGLAVKLPSTFALEGQSPSGPRKPL